LSLKKSLIQSFTTYKNNPALDVNKKIYSYEDLFKEITLISQYINYLCKSNNSNICILGNRSKEVYTAILSIVFSENTYVPLNNDFPKNRLSYIINFSKSDLVIVCKESIENFRQFANDISPLNILLLGSDEDIYSIQDEYKQHKFFTLKNLNSQNLDKDNLFNINKDVNRTLYLMFTSGSTGKPKGVPVSEKNVISYLETILKTYPISSQDKISQSFDISFDLSVHDIFITFLAGATLCVIPKNQLFAPFKFINDKQISIWFSVPSIIFMMDKMKLLKHNSMPSIKLSFFCGEALAVDLAYKWQDAANNSAIENLYGPTEATIAIFNHSFKKENNYTSDTVLIGKIFPNNKYFINNEGILFLSGYQVVKGYFNNIEQTQKSFFKDNDGTIWYNTGDIVKKLDNGELLYLGRNDFQLKIGGFRVELEEIEKLIKTNFNFNFVLALPLNKNNNTASSIIVIIQGEKEKKKEIEILQECKNNLPKYMIPKEILWIADIPLTYNGKVDRKKLLMDYNNEK